MIADRFLHLFDKVISTGQNRWVAICPCHDEKTPSMTITEGDDSVLMHCFGCGANGKDVCERFDINPMELFSKDFTPGDYKKPRIPAADILRCLDYEILFMSCVNRQLLAGQPLRKEDTERLKIAAKRINAAMSAGGLR